MIKETAKTFYADLAAGYAAKIRHPVPQYDDMIQCIIGLLAMRTPETVLDLGSGVGNLSQRVLQALPQARVTAVEASEEMVAAARHRLQTHADRVTLLHQDMLVYEPEAPFDAVFSNLVLHNLPIDEKRRLLQAIVGWLRPGGAFIWGDFIRYSDPRLHAHFVQQRIDFALAAGCDATLVTENFDKEEKEDYPLTAAETHRLASHTGFLDPQPGCTTRLPSSSCAGRDIRSRGCRVVRTDAGTRRGGDTGINGILRVAASPHPRVTIKRCYLGYSTRSGPPASVRR